MLKSKKDWILIIIVSLFIGIITYCVYSLTGERKIVDIDPEIVSKIDVFDGGTGKAISIDGKEDIERVISNLNNITFIKDKSSKEFLGFSFSISIYDNKVRLYKQLVINSNDTIVYKDYFYKDKLKSIDYDYIDSLYEKYDNIRYKP